MKFENKGKAIEKQKREAVYHFQNDSISYLVKKHDGKMGQVGLNPTCPIFLCV